MNHDYSGLRWLAELLTFMRYGLIGALNALVFAAAAWILSRTAMHYSLYTALAYIIAIASSYVMNSAFTFRLGMRGSTLRAVKFFGVCVFLLGLAELTQWLVIEILSAPTFWGIAAGMAVYSGIGYAVNRLWVFGTRA